MSAVDPGQGYRLLKEGEEIPSGAEVWACGNGPWMRVKESVGDTYYPVKDESGYHPMRVPDLAPEPPKSAAPGEGVDLRDAVTKICWDSQMTGAQKADRILAMLPALSRSEAPESQPHTVHPWDALQALKDRGAILFFTADQMPITARLTLFLDGGRWVDAEAPTLSEAVQAAVEKLPVGVRS